MKNRENIYKLIDTIEGQLNNLKYIVNTQQPIEMYIQTLDKSLNLIDDLKTFIETEPLTPNELNRY
jgi:hypothetical protein